MLPFLKPSVRTTWRLATLLLAGTAVSLAPPARAQDAAIGGSQESLPLPAPNTQPVVAPVRASITLSAGSGQVIHLHANAINVFTADPKVAEVRPASANSLFVFGVAPGTTTVAALSAAGDPIAQYQVSVVPSGFDAGQVRGTLSRGGNASISTRATETGVSLSGHVATPGDAERAVSAAKGSLPPDGKVDNHMMVNQSIEVGLHVRIAEMTRTLVRELGVNWSTVGAARQGRADRCGHQHRQRGGARRPALHRSPAASAAPAYRGQPYNLNAVIDALSQDALVHTLAEPNLTTMSGQPASFLVGGEFPIPVATNNNTISVEFKQYGISLAFVPTVISPGRISLHVRPEVSALDKANGVTSVLNSRTCPISIPALTVRRADTTIELGSGQSMAIAGLLSDQTSQTVQATPGLGDIPILGALFRSDSFQRQQTELVIVVTPYIVRPVSDPGALRTPVDGYHAPNDFERILELRQFGRGSYPGYGRIPSDAGFIVE